jgi:hypothetical protein
MGHLYTLERSIFHSSNLHRRLPRNATTHSVELQYVLSPSSFFPSILHELTHSIRTVRLENEHLGNMDQYRVTREVPLPYSIDDLGAESGGEDDMDEEAVSSKRSWRTRRSLTRSGTGMGGDLRAMHA